MKNGQKTADDADEIEKRKYLDVEQCLVVGAPMHTRHVCVVIELIRTVIAPQIHPCLIVHSLSIYGQ
jgi:hypothetical protein